MSEITDDAAIDRQVKHFNDLEFTVIAEVHEYRIEFKIYDIIGWLDDEATSGTYNRPIWLKAGARSSSDFAERLEEADLYLHGHVKWDGCSNWHFDAQDHCMLHGCSKGDVQRFGDIMAACWDWASEACPSWG